MSLRRLGIDVAVPASFSQIYASSSPVTLTASVNDDPTSQGVTWTLSLANTSCSPGCGTLKKSATNPRFSIVYTPPAVPPLNTTATITASSVANNSAVFVFNFTILPAISVTITNKFATQKSADPPIVLNATVSNDLSKEGVTWTLTAGGQPCSAAACGTLTAPPSPTLTATYTPPPTVPSGASDTPTITATSVTDPTKNDSFTFTIVQGIVVTITNKFSKQIIGGPSVIVNASVTADPANAGVTWTLVNASGQACSNCGTLVAAPSPSFSATYTPPTTQPVGPDANPTIAIASVTNPTKTDSFGFVISIGTAAFAGNYAFLLRGYDLTGSPMALAGSVTLDTTGDITNGELDINNGGGITFVSQLSGNFSPDSSFNGIIRMTMNILNAVLPGSTTPGPLPTPLSFKSVLSSDHTRGRILELDGIGFINVGTIQLQAPAALAAANPAGTYVFGVDSDAPGCASCIPPSLTGGRTVEAGQLILTSNSISGGLIDESKAGDATPRYMATPLAGSTLTAPDSSGRGTLTLSVNSSGSGVPASSDHYAYYVINSSQLLLIQIDAAPTFGTVFAGVARSQNALTAASVNTVSVLQMTGMDTIPLTTTGMGPDVIVGVLSIPNPGGGTASTFTLTFDENDLGKTFPISPKNTAGHITFDPTTGRGTLAEPGSGFGVGFMDLAVFYLSDSGQGFIIDADPSTCASGGVCTPPNNYPITNNAFSGTLTPQTRPLVTGCPSNPSGGFSNSSLSGNVLFASGASVIPDIPSVVAGVNFVNNPTAIPPATYTAKGDLVSLNSQAGNLPDVSFSGTYSVQDACTGRTFLRLPPQIFAVFAGIQPNQLYNAFGYLVGPNQVVAIGFGNGLAPSDSGVLFFDPQ